MSDDGRRVPRTFEPPPWEQDRFDELARRKAEETAKAEQARAAEQEALSEAARALKARSATEPEAETAPDEERVSRPAPVRERPALDEAKVDAMLLELAGQERPAVHGIRKAGMAAAWTLSTFGAALLVFGAVLLARGGTTGFAGAAMVIAIGSFVTGFAVWLGFRAGRGQGS